jgi:lipoprotein-anchoring transpeptidase ErfK/SrfK
MESLKLPPATGPWLRVDLDQQSLMLMQGDEPLRRWPVSTALNGPGELNGSGCTPRGWHRVRYKIGDNQPRRSVFVARRPTGEIWTPELDRRFPRRDWILTRILWLDGLEPGRNRGGERDSLRRYIYIHGTPDDQPMGEPRSHGCVRMRNPDVEQLFEATPPATPVLIDNFG